MRKKKTEILRKLIKFKDEITIGRNTTIGAGSVVTKDIPDNVVAAGTPCKVIRNLKREEINENFSFTVKTSFRFIV